MATPTPPGGVWNSNNNWGLGSEEVRQSSCGSLMVNTGVPSSPGPHTALSRTVSSCRHRLMKITSNMS